jgi:hypothetical protein
MALVFADVFLGELVDVFIGAFGRLLSDKPLYHHLLVWVVLICD